MKSKGYKRILRFFIIGIILVIIIIVGMDVYKEGLIKKEQEKELQYNTQQLSISNIYEEKNQVNSITKEYPKEEIIDVYKGYKVAAKLEISKINLETYILQEYSNDALNVSVTKFWGANPNEIGNCCIAGHNFQRENMFHNLKELKIGDKFFISDNKIGKIEYEIYDLYKVYPENVSCLSQETNGNREVTLITCTNDSKRRIIIKAKEI